VILLEFMTADLMMMMMTIMVVAEMDMGPVHPWIGYWVGLGQKFPDSARLGWVEIKKKLTMFFSVIQLLIY